MCVYVYICICVCVFVYLYIYNFSSKYKLNAYLNKKNPYNEIGVMMIRNIIFFFLACMWEYMPEALCLIRSADSKWLPASVLPADSSYCHSNNQAWGSVTSSTGCALKRGYTWACDALIIVRRQIDHVQTCLSEKSSRPLFITEKLHFIARNKDNTMNKLGFKPI